MLKREPFMSFLACFAAIANTFYSYRQCTYNVFRLKCLKVHSNFHCVLTVRTEVFSTKSPWLVFFRGEMAVICHKMSVKYVYKLGPKCR